MQQVVHPDIARLDEQLKPMLKELKQQAARKSKLIESNRQLVAQKSENNLVRDELGKLQPDAAVYKLIGPALIPQDQSDAKSIVNNRLEYINGQIKRVETNISQLDRKETELQKKAQEVYRKMQERYAQINQQQQQQQQQIQAQQHQAQNVI